MSDNLDPSPDFNPYQASASETPQLHQAPHTEQSARSLARWQIFFAVLLAICFLGSFGLMAFSVLAFNDGDVIAMIGGLGCVMLILTMLFLLPAILLWLAARTAREFANSPDSERLAKLISSQLTLWRAIGIVAAILIGFYAFVGVAGLAFGASPVN